LIAVLAYGRLPVKLRDLLFIVASKFHVIVACHRYPRHSPATGFPGISDHRRRIRSVLNREENVR
jgi:hypothetical protein